MTAPKKPASSSQSEGTSLETAKKAAIAFTQDIKITRSEVIDIIVGELESDLRNESDKLRKRQQELEEKTFPLTMFVNAITTGVHVRYSNHCGTYRASVEGDYDKSNIDVSLVSPEIKAYLDEVKAVEKQLCAVQTQLANIHRDKKAFKLTLMKRLLGGTVEGRELLAQIEEVKLQAKAALFPTKCDRSHQK